MQLVALISPCPNLFAPAAFDVEAESPGFVVALDRQRRVGEEVADGVVEADVGAGFDRLFRPIGV